MAHVSIRNVSKIYPGSNTPSVHNLSLEVGDGELVVIVGPSGCGKSTFLRMIAGLESLTSGEIHIGGSRIDTLAAGERDIAMVFQNYALYPHMTARENMSYGLKNRGFSRDVIAARVEETARILQIAPLLDHKPRNLSGGQRQRIAIGRAIIRNPACFLFDEPLSNLDAKLRVDMRVEIKALQKALGATAVYVTHDQVEAMTLADRVVVLNGGRIEQVGTPLEIYLRPMSSFVAGFIGSPAMNLLPCDMMQAALATSLPLPSLGKPQANSITVGIRPEDFHSFPQPGCVPLSRFSISHVEELGAERLVHLRLGVAKAVAKLPAGLPLDEKLTLFLDPQTLHFFSPDGGRL
ncbi:MAG: sn-glycerol-3-phosphate ABC transporter ATP-binding protein UgpC [Gibbsiella quercinecans]|uniref:sn-glycerol-3-phosphate ABC transporter ATP-binding protein UgpC n=1 Tax=Gibbsiella quercinecans TaxID=929813 RepID=UPI003F34F617